MMNRMAKIPVLTLFHALRILFLVIDYLVKKKSLRFPTIVCDSKKLSRKFFVFFSL